MYRPPLLRCEICAVPAEGVHYSVIKEFGVSVLLGAFCYSRKVTDELLQYVFLEMVG